ncbi:DUF429 domain-containing protein [Halovivax sp.]|uniref:DUF429 domain-containing protein n=1 Tax=Halovivax sp. TaxID=1935978 RepID=UPI0025C3064B|nr:DUF429 domain-containing protein [Halovivax sp.]
MTYVGVDGTTDGWLAVVYADDSYAGRGVYPDVEALWAAHGDAETILIDVPIGLREDSAEPRTCDAAARRVLSPDRHSSVFPTPIRPALAADGYEEAKAIQEARTDGSLGVQTWGIADKLRELDDFLRGPGADARGTIREAHPEVCFWALNDEASMRYSKTGQPVAAFWERIDALEAVDPDVLEGVRAAGTGLDAGASNDDLLDAFALALTASERTGGLETLPEEPPTDETGLPMEMVYARPE